ncbi:MAG TPA: amino acid ABC transporter permease [Acidimicrobiales bacterium]|nr:amino acid ABC transporter permease [Acidimicrobiales bacterium]
MTAPVLADALGPRGRRQARILSLVAAVAIGAALFVAFRRLESNRQFAEALWRPFTQWPVLKFLLVGLRNSLTVAVVAMTLSVLIGAVMALGRLARARWVRVPAMLYVELFRALPLYLLIFYCAFGLPQSGIAIELFWALVLGLTLYNSAILGEVFRAGILSLDRGQTEAAFSVGMGYWQAMLLVIVPQALRRMIPAIINQLVTLFKDTSLGIVIAYEEFLRRSEITGVFFQNPLQTFLAAALVYIAINYTMSRLVRRLEVRQRRRYGAGPIQVTGVEELAVVGVTAAAAMPEAQVGAPAVTATGTGAG